MGGELNACYNAIDRHVEAGNGSKVALVYDSPLTSTIEKVTYAQLLDKISHLAGGLAKLGVRKGDKVVIYMPLIPEAIVAMLATVRLGAIHSVVFGGKTRRLLLLTFHFQLTFVGYAARELCSRIIHAEPKVIISASCGIEPNKIVRYLIKLEIKVF